MPTKNREFKFKITNELNTEFRVLREKRRMNTDNFLYSLLLVAKKPIEYQNKYELNYKNGIKVLFSQRVSEKTFIEFRLLSAYFKSQVETLDYLIFNEINGKTTNFGLSDSYDSNSG